MATAPAETAVWNVDPSHTHVEFSIRHLMIATVKGRFNEVEGTVRGDVNDLTTAQVEARVTAESIDTADADRDTHLRSADFFEVDKFPDITFKSTRITKTGDNTYDLEGDLTIRDVTRPVTLAAAFQGTARDPWGNERAAIDAETKVDRKDFGLTWNSVLETGGVLVGDEVNIQLHIELVKESSEKGQN